MRSKPARRRRAEAACRRGETSGAFRRGALAFIRHARPSPLPCPPHAQAHAAASCHALPRRTAAFLVLMLHAQPAATNAVACRSAIRRYERCDITEGAPARDTSPASCPVCPSCAHPSPRRSPTALPPTSTAPPPPRSRDEGGGRHAQVRRSLTGSEKARRHAFATSRSPRRDSSTAQQPRPCAAAGAPPAAVAAQKGAVLEGEEAVCLPRPSTLLQRQAEPLGAGVARMVRRRAAQRQRRWRQQRAQASPVTAR